VAEEGGISILLVRLHEQMLLTRPGVVHAPISSVTTVTSVCTARGDDDSHYLTLG
jgi:hypothetical protein